jgi:hypothetical protein
LSSCGQRPGLCWFFKWKRKGSAQRRRERQLMFETSKTFFKADAIKLPKVGDQKATGLAWALVNELGTIAARMACQQFVYLTIPRQYVNCLFTSQFVFAHSFFYFASNFVNLLYAGQSSKYIRLVSIWSLFKNFFAGSSLTGDRHLAELNDIGILDCAR